MIQEIHAGDRQIPASSWNEMRAAVQGITPGQQQYQSAANNPFLVTVKNVTGGTLDALAIVKIDGATYTRSGDVFANTGIMQGVEVDGATPGADTDNVAILQAACGAGGIVKAIASGCSPCFVYCADSSKTYKYAKPIANNTQYLQATDDPSDVTILWHKQGSGKQAAYVKIDAQGTPEPEYFIINYGKGANDTPTHTPTIYTKGSLHYISYNSAGYWEPSAYNEQPASSTLLKRPDGARLVVCQIDAPSSTAECRIPYFTPESNMGVPASYTSSIGFGTVTRCGVKPGEHTFTNKMCDYAVIANSNNICSYVYSPQFVADVTVNGTTGGGNVVTANICGKDWTVNFPGSGSGLSATNYPDIYPYDLIIVMVDCAAQECDAIDYPTDYEAGTVMPFYGSAPGRGWDSSIYPTPQPLADVGLTLFYKVKTNAIL